MLFKRHNPPARPGRTPLQRQARLPVTYQINSLKPLIPWFS